MLINRDYFNQKPKLKTLKVKLTDNKEIYVREITAAEQRDINEYSFIKDKSGDVTGVDKMKYNERLVAVAICGKDGESLLKPDEYHLVGGGFSSADLTLILLQAIRVNRFDEDLETTTGKS